MSSRVVIPKIQLDTSTLPPADQFAAWSAHSGNSKLTPMKPGAFLAKGCMWTLGSTYVTDIVLDPFTSERDRSLVNATDTEHVQIVVLFDGEVRLEAPGVDQHCAAPDIFVRDFARPSRATASRIHCSVVYFARAFLEQATGPLEFQGRLTPSPELAVFRDTLGLIIQHLSIASATSAGFYARTLRDCIAAAILEQIDRRAPDEDWVQRRAAKAYIAAIPAGTLSVDAMSVAMGVSRSSLYRLFRRDGGVLAFDRLRRLRALYRDVCNAAEHRTLGDLGSIHGFADPAVLARQFRRAFGCSLTELRQSSRIGVPAEGEPAGRVREAIAHLT